MKKEVTTQTMIGVRLNVVTESRYMSPILIAILIAALPIISGCIENTGEEDDPYTEFTILGSNQKAGDYPENFIVNEDQKIFIVLNNQENERVDYMIKICISSNAWSRSYDDLSDIVVSLSYSPEIQLHFMDDEERFIPCQFSIPDVGIFKMRFHLFRDGEEYQTINWWIKVFDNDNMKISPDGVRIYTAGISGDPATLPQTLDPSGFFNFTIGVSSEDKVSLYLNITFRIGEVSDWSKVNWEYRSGCSIYTVFENGTGYYLPFLFANIKYSVIPLRFIIGVEDVQMIIEVRSSDWSVEFSIPIS